MAVFKRDKGETYYYEFELFGQRYKKSTRCKNKRDAEAIKAAARLKVINDRAGIQSSRPPASTLREFKNTFFDWVNSNSKTNYYLTLFNKLLLFEKLAEAPIDRIDEPLIEAYKTWALNGDKTVNRKPLPKETINRCVGALRKALRYARFKLKLIDKLPLFDMYQGTAEPREYVFSQEDYEHWLNSSPEPLKSASILARNCGICRGEILALQKDCVALLEMPDKDGFFGEIEVRRGLKRNCRRRTLKINRPMRDVLQALIAKSSCAHVFTTPDNAEEPLSKGTFVGQARRMKAKGGFHKESGLHTLRHTFLTEMGELTDPFTLQRIAGHNQIKTTMGYVHPEKRTMASAFKKLFGNGQAVAVINEVVLSSTQLACLLAGEVVLLAVPAGSTELRLKSTQEPTPPQISHTENAARV
jgi:integrase